jgi:hypothetical protein
MVLIRGATGLMGNTNIPRDIWVLTAYLIDYQQGRDLK